MTGSMTRDAIAAAIKAKGEGGLINVYCPKDSFSFGLTIRKIKYSKRGKLVSALLKKKGGTTFLKTDRRRNNAPWTIDLYPTGKQRVSRVD